MFEGMSARARATARRALPALAALATLGAAAAGCAEEDLTAESTISAAAGPPAGFGVRVIGGEEILLRSDLYTFPHYPPYPGSNERRLWVPDGPPRAYIDVHGQTRLIVPHFLTYAFVGPNLYSTALNAGDVISDSAQSGNWQAYNDATWPWSPWRLPDGRLAVVNHQEYHCRAHGTCSVDRWYPSLTVSVANDGIHIGTPAFGVIAKSSYPFIGDGTQVHGAYSDPSSIVQSPHDGLYYMIAMYKSGGGDGPVVGNCVLRTSNILDPNAWRAFDGGGFHALPQHGAGCANIGWDGSFAPGSLSYSTYLGRFVYLAFGKYNGRQGFWLRASTANDLTQWSEPVLVLEAPLPWESPQPAGRPYWVYPAFLDPDAPGLGTLNFDRMGQTPYLYWVRLFAGGTHRELVRARVRFEGGAPEIANRMTGLYRIGGGGFYSNGLGSYCAIWSIDQLRGCGWPHDFWSLPEFGNHGANTLQGAYGGRCACGVPPVPFGCYRIGGAGFFSNGQGRSCPFLGSQMQSICGTTDFWSLPARSDHGLNAVDGQCAG